MKVSELNAAQGRHTGQSTAEAGWGQTSGHAGGGSPSENGGSTAMPFVGQRETPASLRLQYEYELERGREISNSITRLVTLIPLMIGAAGFLVWGTVTWCTRNIPAKIFIILGMADIIVLLCALAVACTVHFYILNPAPSEPGEEEWLARMKRDLQRGNNWRGWLVFAATILIYAAGGVTLAILILGMIGL